MYIKRIKISGYGCIDSFDYSFSSDQNGNPKPLVLLGKNGSGKTLVLANIVDALVEIKRKAYPGGILEVADTNYYKVGKHTYIRTGGFESLIQIDFENKNKTYCYHDVMSTNPEKSMETGHLLSEVKAFFDQTKFRENGFDRGVRGDISPKEFSQSVFLYFPVDRYYVPNWFNANNYTKIDYDSDNFVGKSGKRLIKNDIADNISEWLYRVFLGNNLSVNLADSSKQIVPLSDAARAAVNVIFSTIKGEHSSIGPINRKNDNVPFVVGGQMIADIKNLSSGEMNLLSIFSSIVKEYDETHNFRNLSDIEGICLIDEIDLNLHINQQTSVLPKLIKLFPRMQFVITTHSPFFVQGMFDQLAGDVDFVEMPSGQVINSLVDFSEIKEAIRVFQDSGPIIEKLDRIEKEHKRLLEEKNRILVLTEGKTDAKYIIKAFDKLNRSADGLMIETIDPNNIGCGADQLDKLLESQKALGLNANRIIGVFDRDIQKFNDKYSSDSVAEIVPGRVYAFCLPIPDKRRGETEISIEHYFSNDELRTIDTNNRRMYQLEEFYPTGSLKTDNTKLCEYVAKNYKKHQGNYVLSGSGDKKVTSPDGQINFSLSKNDFCENVVNDTKGFGGFDFSDFSLIIDKIEAAKNKMN